jgi:hypothetical protein
VERITKSEEVVTQVSDSCLWVGGGGGSLDITQIIMNVLPCYGWVCTEHMNDSEIEIRVMK